jgi:hypothetical protein
VETVLRRQRKLAQGGALADLVREHLPRECSDRMAAAARAVTAPVTGAASRVGQKRAAGAPALAKRGKTA